jgi:hypothetical protein
MYIGSWHSLHIHTRVLQLVADSTATISILYITTLFNFSIFHACMQRRPGTIVINMYTTAKGRSNFPIVTVNNTS